MSWASGGPYYDDTYFPGIPPDAGGMYDPSVPSMDDLAMLKRRKPGFMDRLKGALPGMITGAIAAGATPNIAGGGGTDIMRSLAAAQGANQQHDLLLYNIGRQRQQDMLARQKAAHDVAKFDLDRQNVQSEIAAREAQARYHDANSASLAEDRAAQKQLREAQAKGAELQRQLALGQAGAQEIPDVQTQVDSPGSVSVPIPLKVPGAVPKGMYDFKDPFTGKRLAVRAKNGDVELDPDVAETIGIQPNADGKYVIDQKSLAGLIKNRTVQPKPPKLGNLVTPEVGKKAGVLPDEDGQYRLPDSALSRAVGSEFRIVTPRQKSERAIAAEELRAAKNAVLGAAGNDWGKAAQLLQSGKFDDDPTVAPYKSDVLKEAASESAKMAKANEPKGALAGIAARADATMTTGGRVIKAIDDLVTKHPNYFGPLAGRTIGAGSLATNSLPPELRDLVTQLKSFFAYQPAQHGFRANQAIESFQKSAGADGAGVFVNPEAVKAGVRAIMQANKDLRGGIRTGRLPEGIELPPEAAGALTQGAPAASTQATVRVIAPQSGKVKQIPADQLEDYVSNGYRKAQ